MNWCGKPLWYRQFIAFCIFTHHYYQYLSPQYS